MNSPSVFGPVPDPPKPPPAHEGIDWKIFAPRWLLVTIAGVAISVAGVLGWMLNAELTAARARLETAIRDAPTIYQARLSERVAVTETEIVVLKAQYLRLNVAVEKMTEATNDLTSQLKVLTAELRHQRGGRAQ